VILFQKDGAQNDGAVFLGGSINYASPTETTCVEISKPCSATQEPYCKDAELWTLGSNGKTSDVSSLRVFDQYLHTSVLSGSQTTQSAPPPSGDGVTLFGNYDFNEQDPGSRTDEQQIHCGPINVTTAPGSDLETGKPFWVDGSNSFGTDILYPNTTNTSKLDCQQLFSNHWASSIRIDGDYIAVLFRDDGRTEIFKAPGDYRLRDNHIGDDGTKYLLIIPIKKKQ
jgi:hypothetical protein